MYIYIYIYINKVFLNIIIRFSQNVYRDDKRHFHLLILSGRVKLTEWSRSHMYMCLHFSLDLTPTQTIGGHYNRGEILGVDSVIR